MSAHAKASLTETSGFRMSSISTTGTQRTDSGLRLTRMLWPAFRVFLLLMVLELMLSTQIKPPGQRPFRALDKVSVRVSEGSCKRLTGRHRRGTRMPQQDWPRIDSIEELRRRLAELRGEELPAEPAVRPDQFVGPPMPSEPTVLPEVPPPDAGYPAGNADLVDNQLDRPLDVRPGIAPATDRIGVSSGEMGSAPPVGGPFLDSGPSIPGNRPPGESPTGRPFANTLEAMLFKQRQTRGQLQQLRGDRDIREGFGNIWIPTAGSIMHGRTNPNKVVAEDARSEIAERENLLAPENDGSSDISKSARAMVEKAMNIKLDESTPYSVIATLIPNVTRTLLAQSSMDADRQAVQTQEASDLQGIIGKERELVLNNQRIKKLKDTLANAKNIITFMEGNNPSASRAALVKAARAGGEVGVLTERDIAGWEGEIGVPGLINKVIKGVIGDYSPSVKKNVTEIARKMVAAAEEEIRKDIEGRKETFNQVYGDRFKESGIDLDSIMEKIYSSSIPQLQGQSSDPGTFTFPDGTPGKIVPNSIRAK